MSHKIGAAMSWVIAVLGVGVGLGAAAYWIAGALMHDGGVDHFVGPYSVDVALLRIVGVAALVAGAVSVVVLSRWHLAARLPDAWIVLAGIVGVSAVVSALTWRVCTAGVTGESIGGPVLLLVSSVCWIFTIIVVSGSA